MPHSRRWSDADRELVAGLVRALPPPPSLPGAIGGLGPSPEEFADDVLDALTAAGWRPARDCHRAGSVLAGSPLHHPLHDLPDMVRGDRRSAMPPRHPDRRGPPTMTAAADKLRTAAAHLRTTEADPAALHRAAAELDKLADDLLAAYSRVLTWLAWAAFACLAACPVLVVAGIWTDWRLAVTGGVTLLTGLFLVGVAYFLKEERDAAAC